MPIVRNRNRRHPDDVQIKLTVEARDPRIDELLCLVRSLITQGEIEMADLSELQAAVEANTSTTGSVAELINRLADQLEAGGADQAAIDDLVAQLRDNDTVLADLVVANTPAAEDPNDPPVDPVDPQDPQDPQDPDAPFDPDVPRPA